MLTNKKTIIAVVVVACLKWSTCFPIRVEHVHLRQRLDCRTRRIFLLRSSSESIFHFGERRRKMFSKKTMTKFAIVVAVVLFFLFYHTAHFRRAEVVCEVGQYKRLPHNLYFAYWCHDFVGFHSAPRFYVFVFRAGFLYGVVGGFFLDGLWL